MKQLQEIVATVARIADTEGLTPFGLLDYLRDMDRNPDYYGPRQADIEARLFGDTGLTPEDVTTKVCSLAVSHHLTHVRESIRRWQREADEAKVPVTYVLAGDSELGYEAVMRNRWGKGTVATQAPGDPIPTLGRRARPRGLVVLGQPVETLVRWMGSEGWDLHDAGEALAMYGVDGSDMSNANLAAWLAEGRAGHSTDVPIKVREKLREALE